MPDPPRCDYPIRRRDTYRSTGRGRGGNRFELCYEVERCKRNAKPGRRRCWQHDWLNEEDGRR